MKKYLLIFSPDAPYCLLFSTKSVHSNLIKSLALDFDILQAVQYTDKKFLSFGQVDATASKLGAQIEVVALSLIMEGEKYHVTEIPSVVLITSDGLAIKYTGALEYGELYSFFDEYAETVSDDFRQRFIAQAQASAEQEQKRMEEEGRDPPSTSSKDAVRHTPSESLSSHTLAFVVAYYRSRIIR